MSNIQISDLSQLAFAILATLTGLFGCVLAVRNEMKRRVRGQLRKFLVERTERTADVLERELAELIGGAIKTKAFTSLETVSLVPYVEDYMIDIEFKPKLFHFLIDFVKKNQVELTEHDLTRIQEVVDVWKAKDTIVDAEISSLLDAAVTKNNEMRTVQQFVRSKPRYIGTKTNEFADDVKEVVEGVLEHAEAA